MWLPASGIPDPCPRRSWAEESGLPRRYWSFSACCLVPEELGGGCFSGKRGRWFHEVGGCWGLLCPQIFFSVNMPDSDTRGGESPRRIKLISCCGHDLGAVIFRLLSKILGRSSQNFPKALSSGPVTIQAFLLSMSSCKSQESYLKAF